MQLIFVRGPCKNFLQGVLTCTRKGVLQAFVRGPCKATQAYLTCTRKNIMQNSILRCEQGGSHSHSCGRPGLCSPG